MALRIPAGRAGRLWLLGRIDAGRRGAAVLEQKRQALLREQFRVGELLAGAERDWDAAAREAAEWLRRAAVLAGGRPLRLAALHSGADARVDVDWRNALGVAYPAQARVELPGQSLSSFGGTAAVGQAAAAHRRAVEAAARFAVLRTAHERLGAELRRTARRLRAIERRWLPEHERALAALELSLDEIEREEIARVRWTAAHVRPL
jgi:H(+)-transporting ATP synthase subunit D